MTRETAQDRAYPPGQHGKGPELRLPSYLERSEDGLGGRCTGVPDRQDVPVQVDEGMVVERYAR